MILGLEFVIHGGGAEWIYELRECNLFGNVTNGNFIIS